MTIMRFESKIDCWIPVLLFGGLSAGSLAWAIDAERTWSDSLGLYFGWALSIWMVLQIYYEFHGDHLLVRCGPFWRTLLIRDIGSVEPTRNLLASMALSLDRIAIKVRSVSGPMISPRDKTRFLKELAKKRAPRGPNCHERTG